MNKLKFILPALILVGGLVSSTVSFGKPEYTKKEKKTCIYCHTKAGSKDLNKVGECYAKKHSLEGCEAK